MYRRGYAPFSQFFAIESSACSWLLFCSVEFRGRLGVGRFSKFAQHFSPTLQSILPRSGRCSLLLARANRSLLSKDDVTAFTTTTTTGSRLGGRGEGCWLFPDASFTPFHSWKILNLLIASFFKSCGILFSGHHSVSGMSTYT